MHRGEPSRGSPCLGCHHLSQIRARATRIASFQKRKSARWSSVSQAAPHSPAHKLSALSSYTSRSRRFRARAKKSRNTRLGLALDDFWAPLFASSDRPLLTIAADSGRLSYLCQQTAIFAKNEQLYWPPSKRSDISQPTVMPDTRPPLASRVEDRIHLSMST